MSVRFRHVSKAFSNLDVSLGRASSKFPLFFIGMGLTLLGAGEANAERVYRTLKGDRLVHEIAAPGKSDRLRGGTTANLRDLHDVRDDAAAPTRVADARPAPRPALRAGPKTRSAGSSLKDQCHRTKSTFYNPKDGSSMEGGSKNRFEERVLSVQDAIRTGNPVTVAMDSQGDFGKQCNQRAKRCTVLVCNPGFDDVFPQYRRKFTNVPPNCFLGIVEDTGGAFRGRGTSKLDIASASSSHARANPRGTERSTFQIVENPCGTGARARNCDLSAKWKPDQHAFADSCGTVAAFLQNRGRANAPANVQVADVPPVRSAPITTGVN